MKWLKQVIQRLQRRLQERQALRRLIQRVGPPRPIPPPQPRPRRQRNRQASQRQPPHQETTGEADSLTISKARKLWRMFKT